MSKLINAGYGNCINTSEILAIINPNSNPKILWVDLQDRKGKLKWLNLK